MRQTCEVCDNFRNQGASPEQRIVEVKYPERSVLLCSGHAKIAERSGVSSLDGLRDFYGSGRRSYVPRRKPAALQADGEARRGGRRATDA